MREVKFRGLDVMTGDWIHGNLVKLGTGSHYIIPQNFIGHQIPQWAVDKKSVGQFTGLLDKNGKEIYEGDIVKRDFEIGHSKYDSATLGFVDYEIEDSGYFIGKVHYRPSEGFILTSVNKFDDEHKLIEKKGSKSIKIYPNHAAVIGNAYQHPHLLKENEVGL